MAILDKLSEEGDVVPHHEQTKGGNKTLSKYAEEMKNLDIEIEELRSRLKKLKAKRQKMRARHETISAISSSIQTLPPEIMGEIFIHCTPIYTYDNLYDAEDVSAASGPLLLFRVCQQWRRIVLQTPSLFTNVVLHGEAIINPFITLQMYLAHSGSLPLTISIKPERWVSNPMAVAEALHNLSGHLWHIKTLRISISKYLESLLPIMTHIKAPMLQNLQLIPRESEAIPSANVDALGTLSAPELRRFRCDVKFRWEPFICLRNGITSFHDKHGLYGPEDLLRILSGWHNLEKFCLCYTETFVTDLGFLEKYRSPVLVPKLQVLELTWAGKSDYLPVILSQIMAPSLLHLLLRAENEPSRDDILESVHKSLMSSGNPASLVALSLHNIAINPQDFRALLQDLSSLTDLSITGTVIQKGILAYLNRDLEPALGPSLTHIDFSGSVFIAPRDLFKLLRSRALPSWELKEEDKIYCIEQLESVKLCGCQELPAKWGNRIGQLALEWQILLMF